MNQDNKVLIILASLVVIGFIAFCCYQKSSIIPQNDYKNISYQIEGQVVKLNNGIAETEIVPDSASKNITRFFGNEVFVDFNNDNLKDAAFLLTQNNGGSGTFYYLVAAIKNADGYVGTNAILIGDRIAPQTTEFRDGEIIVNYADRKIDEPMTSQPSLGVSRYFKINEGLLVEVIK
jgi:hypothetical protein